MTRKEAQAAGVKRYHGKPCKNCGGTEKVVSSRACIVCARARKRVANMSPEQIKRKRERNRIENMTPEQIKRKRTVNARNERRFRASLKGRMVIMRRQIKQKEIQYGL